MRALILLLCLAAPAAASNASGSSSVGKYGLGASAVSNASGGQGGASKAMATTGPVSANVGVAGGVWLPDLWRPNAWVTPWSPVVLPPEAAAPVVPTMPRIPEEKEVSFWFNGTKYVLE